MRRSPIEPSWRRQAKRVMVMLNGTRVEFYGPWNEKMRVEAWAGGLLKQEVMGVEVARDLAKAGLAAGGKWK